MPESEQYERLPSQGFLPAPEPAPEQVRPVVEYERLGTVLGRKVGRAVKHGLIGYSQSELNENVIRGLRQQFNPANTDAAIDQAFSIFYQRMGPEANRPELYELYENSDLDRAIESLGKRWVIGRPKKRTRK